MKRTHLIAFIGFDLLLIVAFFATPYFTAYRMKLAADAHDGAALSEHIEFPSVRQSLKDQINATVAAELEQQKKSNPIAAMLGAAGANLLADKLVETYVTPEGISQLMAGTRPSSTPAPTDPKGTTPPPAEKKAFHDAQFGYTSFNEFNITVKGEKKVKIIIFSYRFFF